MIFLQLLHPIPILNPKLTVCMIHTNKSQSDPTVRIVCGVGNCSHIILEMCTRGTQDSRFQLPFKYIQTIHTNPCEVQVLLINHFSNDLSPQSYRCHNTERAKTNTPSQTNTLTSCTVSSLWFWCRECPSGGALYETYTSIRECTEGVLIWTLPY